MTRIGLISDVHSSPRPLREALSIFTRERVSHIICAGDIAGYGEGELDQTVALLRQHDCLVVAGNHDTLPPDEELDSEQSECQDFLQQLPRKLDLDIAGKRIYVVHAHPPEALRGGIKLLDPQAQIDNVVWQTWHEAIEGLGYDVLVVGHTHQVFAVNLGSTLLINPGSTLFNHSCMILDLPSMQVRTFALSGMSIVRTWNWDIFSREHTADVSRLK